MKARVPAAGVGKRGAEGHIGYLLRQAQGAARQRLDAALASQGLTSPQFLLLNLLDAYPGASGADLARTAQLTPQTINLIVRKLEADGLLARSEHESHGRVLRLEVTTDGQARLKACKRLADGVEAELLALLDPASEAVVRRWLAAVAAALLRE